MYTGSKGQRNKIENKITISLWICNWLEEFVCVKRMYIYLKKYIKLS